MSRQPADLTQQFPISIQSVNPKNVEKSVSPFAPSLVLPSRHGAAGCRTSQLCRPLSMRQDAASPRRGQRGLEGRGSFWGLSPFFQIQMAWRRGATGGRTSQAGETAGGTPALPAGENCPQTSIVHNCPQIQIQMAWIGGATGCRTSQGGARDYGKCWGFRLGFAVQERRGRDARAPRGLSGCGADGMGRGEARNDGGEIRRV